MKRAVQTDSIQINISMRKGKKFLISTTSRLFLAHFLHRSSPSVIALNLELQYKFRYYFRRRRQRRTLESH